MVATESEVLAKFHQVRPVIERLARAFNEYAAVLNQEALLAEAEDLQASLGEQVDAAGAALSKMPHGARSNSLENQSYEAARAYRDELVRRRDQAAGAVEELRRQQAPSGRRDELAKDYVERRSDFLKAAGELRPLVETVRDAYRRFQADRDVREAVAASARATKSAVFLGPTKEFAKVVEMIREADRASESVSGKRRRRASAKAPASRSPTSGSGRRN